MATRKGRNMITAAEARTEAAAKAEENRIRIQEQATKLIEDKVENVIRKAMDDGTMSVSICLSAADHKVVDAVYEQLAAGGFDIAVASGEGLLDGRSWATVYWSKDRGGEPGKITRPKYVVLK